MLDIYPSELPESDSLPSQDGKAVKRPPIPETWLLSCYIATYMSALLMVMPGMWAHAFFLAAYSFSAGLTLSGPYRVPRTLMLCVFAAGAIMFCAWCAALEVDYQSKISKH
jgi:hypothetical protein